jgi:MFS family permease
MPCILYVSSMAAAACMGHVNKRFGRRTVFCSGFALATTGLVGLYVLPSDSPWCWFVLPCCVLIGLGNGSVMVCCTQLTSDLIGSRTNYAAFVFGSFSMTDKLASGIVLFLLQTFNSDETQYVRVAISVPPIVAAGVASLLLLTKVDMKEWRRKHHLPCKDGLEHSVVVGGKPATKKKKKQKKNKGEKDPKSNGKEAKMELTIE